MGALAGTQRAGTMVQIPTQLEHSFGSVFPTASAVHRSTKVLALLVLKYLLYY
jgi:hypothetical protein